MKHAEVIESNDSIDRSQPESLRNSDTRTVEQSLESEKNPHRASSILLPNGLTALWIPPTTTSSSPVSRKFSSTNTEIIEMYDRPPAVPPKSPAHRFGTSVYNRTRNNTPLGGASPVNNNSPHMTPKRDSPLSGFQGKSFTGQRAHKASVPDMWSTKSHQVPVHGRGASVPDLRRSNSTATVRVSPQNYQPHRIMTPEPSILERGRPTKRVEGIVKKPLKSRSNSTEEDLAFVELPKGDRPALLGTHVAEVETETLHRQAIAQAENFEVLRHADVNALSKVREDSFALIGVS